MTTTQSTAERVPHSPWKRLRKHAVRTAGALGLAGAMLAPATMPAATAFDGGPPASDNAADHAGARGAENASQNSAHHTDRLPEFRTAAQSAEGPKDTTAVMFQWTWNSIARECRETLGPAGYGYVQTSPTQEHIQGEQWWTHYQPVSYQIESRLGTREEFADMVTECNDAGVKVIADVVINHMTGQQEGVGWAGSEFTHTDYPGTYSSDDFHNHGCEVEDYTDRWQVQECDLLGLADLKTSSDYVQSRIAEHLEDLIDLGVEGFRIDAVKHISADDLTGILDRVDLTDIYVVSEVIRGGGEPIQPEEYQHLGDVHEFTWGRKLKEAFDGGDIHWLLSGEGIGETWEGFIADEHAGTFVDNHDTERNGETLSYKDGEAYRLAQAFTLAWPYGMPAVHSGYSFSDYDAGPVQHEDGRIRDAVCGEENWTCIHAQTEVANMVGFRNAVGDAPVTDTWTNDSHALAFGRGDQGFLVANRGPNSVQHTWQTSLPAGEYCNVYTGSATSEGCSGETVTVAADGTFSAHVGPDSAVALHVGATPASGDGDGDGDGSTPPEERELSLFYATDWETPYVHYQVGDGEWTDAPGEALTEVCEGWAHTEIDLGTARTITAAFNDGGDAWDNNAGEDYTIGSGVIQLADGQLAEGDPCEAQPAPGEDPDLTVYYETGWENPRIHYQVGDGGWTDVPGVAMAEACEGWFRADIQLDDADGITAAFNDGAGTWDNNDHQDYSIAAGEQQVSEGEVTAGNPC